MVSHSPQQLDSLVDEVLLTALTRFASDSDVSALGQLYAWLGEHEHEEEQAIPSQEEGRVRASC